MRIADELPSDDERASDEYERFSVKLYQDILDYLNHSEDLDDWFHKTIFKYVFIEGWSIRELERKSKIHFNILQSSVVRTKKILLKYYYERTEERD